MAMSMASSRVDFIRRFARREGISTAALNTRWDLQKSGYQTVYDKPFQEFRDWWDRTRPHLDFCPEQIRPGVIADYLIDAKAKGASISQLRNISSSISKACQEATDGRLRPGASLSVTSILKGFRQAGGRPQKQDPYGDVKCLYQAAWSYGPDAALSQGHLKEKLLWLLAADTAARPSDLWKLFKTDKGRHRQVQWMPDGVQIRYFWPKEVDPGSSRSNSSSVYFSKWVKVHNTNIPGISTPQCLREFMRRTDEPELYQQEFISEIQLSAQPMFYARLKDGKYQRASIDHISNVISSGLKWANMRGMTPKSIRGASPSKIIQLCPSSEAAALALGRWTTPKTFYNHYQGPVHQCPTDVKKLRSANPQQILRYGFTAPTPTGVTVAEYMRPPDHWIGSDFTGFGKVISFSDGLYTVQKGRISRELLHWDFMRELGRYRK